MFGDFQLNVTTGVSKPILTGPELLDLNSINVSGGAGSLTIGLTDTDYTGDTGFAFGVGGTTTGHVSAAAFLDIGNTAFGTGTAIGSSMDFDPLAFSGTDSIFAQGLAGPYSLSLFATVDHSAGGGSTSFDAAINVPEPSILALFGLGLAGMGFSARRRKSSKA